VQQVESLEGQATCSWRWSGCGVRAWTRCWVGG
jgi:hypothetical protein